MNFRPSEYDDLRAEQQATLSAPPRDYGWLARVLFLTMDVVYGKKRTLDKFHVLEVIARVPYQAWENVGYIAITHTHWMPDMARRIFEFVKEARDQQDNEQWHLLILEEQVQARGAQLDFVRRRVIPQLIALLYYHISWGLFVLNPRRSFRLNADFEDHAEREYMQFIAENPWLDHTPFESSFTGEYGDFATLGDALRRIALDEREHKLESEANIAAPRFGKRLTLLD